MPKTVSGLDVVCAGSPQVFDFLMKIVCVCIRNCSLGSQLKWCFLQSVWGGTEGEVNTGNGLAHVFEWKFNYDRDL